jgi:two-component system sensor histidine kinase/response regulator
MRYQYPDQTTVGHPAPPSIRIPMQTQAYLSGGSCYIDNQGRFLHVNASFTRAFGWNETELIGYQLSSFAHPEDQVALWERMQDLRMGHHTVAFIARFRNREGIYASWEWVLFGGDDASRRTALVRLAQGPDSTLSAKQKNVPKSVSRPQLSSLEPKSRRALLTTLLNSFEGWLLEVNDSFDIVNIVKPWPDCRIREWIGRNILNLLTPVTDDQPQRNFRQLLTAGRACEAKCYPESGLPQLLMLQALGSLPDAKTSLLALKALESRGQPPPLSKHLDAEVDWYRRAMDNACLFSVSDMSGTILYVNSAFEQTTGYSSKELVGHSHRILNANVHPAPFFADLWHSVNTGKIWRGEICNRTKDGRLFWVDTTVVPCRPEEWQRPCVLTIMVDITDRKRYLHRMQHKEEFQSKLLKMAPVGMAWIDLQLQFLFVNEFWCEITQTRARDSLGLGWRRMFHKDDIVHIDRQLERTMRAEKPSPSVLRIKRSDGGQRWVRCQFADMKDSYGKRMGYIMVMTDVTDFTEAHEALQRKEAELKESYDRKSALLRVMPDLILTLNSQYEIREILGNREHPFFRSFPCEVGSQLLNLLPSEVAREATRHALEAVFSNHLDWQEWELDLSRHEQVLDCQCRLLSMNGAEALLLIQDITERKQSNRELMRAKTLADEASRAKSIFLANMSHEIRTPLNAIFGATCLLQDHVVTEEQQTYVRILNEASSNLKAIVSDILDLSKIESGKFEMETAPFLLNQALQGCLSLFHVVDKQVEINSYFDPKLPERLLGDEVRVKQILTNLLNNSIKFTKRGWVRLEAHCIGESAERKVLQFIVEDTGIGIPAHKLPLLFSPFSQADVSITRKYGGTGLGLTICKRLCEMMDGTIHIESVEHQGTRITVTIPFHLPAQSRPQGSDPRGTFDFRGRYVLLAEDNAMNQIVMVATLEKLGIRVKVVSDGLQAVEAVKAEDFDCVLMDVQMPVMDGITAALQIKELRRHPLPPIIAMTANVLQSDIEAYRGVGMIAFIPKPFQKSLVISALQRAWNRPAVQEERLA